MEANIKRLSMQVKFGADGDQELDLVQSRALSELVEHISSRDAENSRLRSELAAIRDAGDEAILSLGGLYQQADTFYQRLQICGTIQEIAVARGARVRELERERDEAIHLLRWLVARCEETGPAFEFGDYEKPKRIKELTAKREGE